MTSALALVSLADLATHWRDLALSAGSVVAFVVVWWAIRRVADRVRGEFGARLLDLLLGLLLLGLLVAEGSALVYIWNVEARLFEVLRQIGDPITVGARVFVSLAIAALTYVATGVIRRAIENVAKRRDGISDHEVEISFRLVQVSLYLVMAFVLLRMWGVDLSGFLIGAGFLGIVLGMAARQTLGAVLAGFVLMFARPFEIGDWVQVGENEGIVTEISIVNTRIQTFDGEYVMLPNDYVGSQEVINRSRKGRLRLHVEVGVDYGADVDQAVEVAEEAMRDVEDVLSVPRPQAVLASFDDSAVTIDLRFWIDKPSARRKWRAHTAVISAVHETFDEHDIKIPFPQRELSARPETEGFRVRDGADAPVDEADDSEATEGER
ncbi:mechanosensitive ion channel family protein [Halarchaeum sp. CBA1220]|uniref:mechanosensitive ion channel family protein n=1 Tax=Halarchaeum sp. CBA1220 TaxID=1853682 RepID=UPI0015A0785E|nr:mechanosensitive ion channel family protein [Halarchaeum sp. CBA1220]QLC34552.1 mechanosensitive ion channel family protein [Halarchaeum sp. CBA1220]